MEKPAKTDYEIHPLLKKRWSPRALASGKIETDKWHRLFEAARWSPSCNNEQPWQFIVGQNGDETFGKILSTLADGNVPWAKNAGGLVIIIGKKVNDWSAYDTGQSIAYFSVQATAEDLFVHQMAGFDPKKAAEIFGIPEESQALVAMAVGYAGDIKQLPEYQQKRELQERARNPQKEFVFSGKFGQPATL